MFFSRILEDLEKRWLLAILLLFLLFLVLKLGIIYYNHPDNLVLHHDGYIYLLKALEITKGDFSPIKTHAIGWPIFLSGFLYLFSSASIFENMIYVIIIWATIAALTLFPLVLIGREVFPDKKQIVLLAFIFILAEAVIKFPWLGFAEPLFTLLWLFSLFFIIKSRSNQNWILLAATFGGLAYWVKPQGIVILLVIIFSFLFLRKHIRNFNPLYFIYIIIIFFLISTPFLYQRYLYFGSPFTYGENDKYLVETYEQLWGKLWHQPTLTEYLKAHTAGDYFNKFIFYGFFQVIAFYLHFIISPLLLPFFLWGLWLSRRDKQLSILSVSLIIWVLSLIPIFAVLAAYRHLYHTLAPIIILAVVGLNHLINSQGRIWLIIFLTIFVLLSMVEIYYYINYDLLNLFTRRKLFEDNFLWARDISQKIRGKLAIGTGSDLIMMNFPDTTIGGRGMFELAAPQSGLSIIYPGPISDWQSVKGWFKENGVTHVALDDNYLNQTQWRRINLLVSENKEVPPYFKKVYSNQDKNPQWSISVYAIDWEGADAYNQ